MKKIVLSYFLLISTLSFAQDKTENVILVTLDGFRWQEVFNGADSTLFKQQTHLKDPMVRDKYWRDSQEERRKALLPFIWTTIGTKGQIHGNRNSGSKVNLTNNQLFSYPGYNELLTGKADNERINTNDKIYNPNPNVLEFLNKQKGFTGKVAAFSSWDVFPFIINDKRSGVYVSTGVKPVEGRELTDREKALNDIIMSIPNPLAGVRLDAFTFYYGFEYLKKNKPRVLYFAFDETDDFAHSGEYAAYLNSANYTDRFLNELWNYIQTEPAYKNKTTMIITCDHGRGNNSESWKHHGQKVPEADQMWFAMIGPGVKALGEVKSEEQLYHNQIAKTMAGLLGFDFTGAGIGEVIPTASVKK